MRTIKTQTIINRAVELIYEANFVYQGELLDKLKELEAQEQNPLSTSALSQIIANTELAKKEALPLCQDTGTSIFFVKQGSQVALEEPIEKILTKANTLAYQKYYLRKSILSEPLFERQNTQTNSPPFIHLEQTAGEDLELTFMAKGGGAENKSTLKMLNPAEGITGVKNFVSQTLKNAGGAACPPFIIAIGIGGTFDTVASLAKKAILRGVNNPHPNPHYRQLETEIKDLAEDLELGAMGYGGREYVLGVNIEYAPTHIASLPIAINLQCHSARWATGKL
jgi:fumarate hydratase subunit alpha